MNQRIRELAEQAEMSANQGDHVDVKIMMEKFAELIVKECLNQCYFRGMNDELYSGQLRGAAYIEEHFGVEE